MKNYDLVIIGSGVGLNIIGQAINEGWNCALIEDAKMGGTCLTRGCIPSKVLVYPADMIREAEHAKNVGITFNIETIDWEKISQRMWSQINESGEIEKSLANIPNLDVYRGRAEFTGTYEMKVKLNETHEYSPNFKGKRFVIASGGRSFIPPISGIKEVGFVTTESFFGQAFPKQPWKSLIIIGGGVIAAEFAHIFSAMGTKVTVIEMLPRLVSTEEPEISQVLEDEFRQHMTVITGAKAISAKNEGDQKSITVEFLNTGKTAEYHAEEILVAAGRRSNADLLRVENTGVTTDRQGWVISNKFLETNVENIWVVGDANGKFQFRHKANHDAEICARNIFGEEKHPVDYSAVPWAIFTYPQIAHVGLTEQQAIDQGYEIFVAKKGYGTVAKGFAMGLDSGVGKEYFFKLVVNRDYRILGAHAIGPHAAIMVQAFVYLMNSGFNCAPEEDFVSGVLSKAANACPDAGSFMPIYKSMVIHPSLNEVSGWALGNLKPVNIDTNHHHS